MQTSEERAPGPQHPVEDVARTPCFFSQVCRRRTAVEKAGRSVCAGCAKRLHGIEYPSRDPSADPSYPARIADANTPELSFDVSEDVPEVPEVNDLQVPLGK